jgi:hypothetical protein
MLKKIMSVMFLLCLSFQSLADVAVTDLYPPLENKKLDKPYTDFIEPLSKIIGTVEPMPKGLDSVEFIENVTGLKFARFYETPIIEQERKIVQYDFKTNGLSLKASKSYAISFFLVNHKVEKILLNVQSHYGDDYYKLNSKDEAKDNRSYLNKKLTASGWTLDNPWTSLITGSYVYKKDNIELVARDSVFYPLEIDIKRTDLANERDKFDDLTKLDREMLTQKVEENRKKRFED